MPTKESLQTHVGIYVQMTTNSAQSYIGTFARHSTAGPYYWKTRNANSPVYPTYMLSTVIDLIYEDPPPGS